VAHHLAGASGVVPVILAIIGPCVSGPALLAGMADHVVMTADAFAYVTGPRAVEAFTGEALDAADLGGSARHHSRTGVASLIAQDEDDALAAVADLLAYLPDNNMKEAGRE
jgi:propionyl-CoA carboxylase beta chain